MGERWVQWYGEGIDKHNGDAVKVGVYVWIGDGGYAYQYVVTDRDGVSANDAWTRFGMNEDAEIRDYMFENFGIPVDTPIQEQDDLTH